MPTATTGNPLPELPGPAYLTETTSNARISKVAHRISEEEYEQLVSDSIKYAYKYAPTAVELSRRMAEHEEGRADLAARRNTDRLNAEGARRRLGHRKTNQQRASKDDTRAEQKARVHTNNKAAIKRVQKNGCPDVEHDSGLKVKVKLNSFSALQDYADLDADVEAEINDPISAMDEEVLVQTKRSRHKISKSELEKQATAWIKMVTAFRDLGDTAMVMSLVRTELISVMHKYHVDEEAEWVKMMVRVLKNISEEGNEIEEAYIEATTQDVTVDCGWLTRLMRGILGKSEEQIVKAVKPNSAWLARKNNLQDYVSNSNASTRSNDSVHNRVVQLVRDAFMLDAGKRGKPARVNPTYKDTYKLPDGTVIYNTEHTNDPPPPDIYTTALQWAQMDIEEPVEHRANENSNWKVLTAAVVIVAPLIYLLR
jgi:hypothetical protein